MAPQLYLSAAVIGIGATAFMDLVALFQRHVLSQRSLDYAMVGRWLGHVAHGHLIHRPISASAPITGERALGWAAHYLTGVLFAAVFLTLVGPAWLTSVSMLPAVVFGLVTVLAPFLILQPGMGAGLAARHVPQPNAARLKSIIAHLSFGIGLWLSGVCLSMFL